MRLLDVIVTFDGGLAALGGDHDVEPLTM